MLENIILIGKKIVYVINFFSSPASYQYITITAKLLLGQLEDISCFQKS